MSSAWPSSLPQDPSVIGYKEAPVDRVQRSTVGVALDNMQWVDAPEIVTVTLEMVLSRAQSETLLDFYTDTVGVVGEITWRDFLTTDSPQTCTYRFVTPPTFSFIEAGWWRASFTLERVNAQ